MNNYIKSFIHRGLIFSGFGPVIVGIAYLFVSEGLNITFSGKEMFLAILSGYFIAFIQAGASVFNQIEEWPPAKSLFVHLSTLYVTYTFFYIINSWIPFDPLFLLIFSGIFVILYLTIWLTVYFTVKTAAKRFDKNLKG